MASTFTFISHLITRITMGRSILLTVLVSKVENSIEIFSEQYMELVFLMTSRLERASMSSVLKTEAPLPAHTLV